ncbi:16679_t:CDS:1, partial [Racocetra persica]
MPYYNIPAKRILSTSTYNDITLSIVQDYLNYYYIEVIEVKLMRFTISDTFTVPNVNEVINFQNGSTVSPNCFILFRREVQTRISDKGLRIGRTTLSKLLSAIWKDLRENEPNLVNSFKAVASNAARIFCGRRL